MDLKFYPSAASRWLTCTASPTVDVSDLKEPPRTYADRGEKLHEIAEVSLRDPTWKPSAIPNGVTEEDLASVKEYVDFVRARPGFKVYEVKAEFTPDCRGRIDTVIFDPPWLEIIDYKAGYIFVDPEENEQLIIYALAVAKKFRAIFDFTKVKLTIAQPAAGNFNSWNLSMGSLDAWGKKIEEIIEEIKGGEDLEFKPSEDRCRWCPAKPICPALQKHVDQVAADDFRGANDLSWKEKLDLVPLLKEWCKGVEAQTRSMLLSGDTIEGWKVVRGRRGNRAWKNEKRAVKFLTKKWNLGLDKIFKPGTLLTPSAIEKLVKGDEERPKKALARYIEPGAEGSPTIVPESNPRKELTQAELAKDDFANLPNDDEEE